MIGHKFARRTAAPGPRATLATVAGAPAAIGRRLPRITTALASGAVGFLSGVAFWHAVGFWSFVSEAVFHRRSEGQAAVHVVQARRPAAPGSASGAASSCSAIYIDRMGGPASVGACDVRRGALRTASGIGKADFGDFGKAPVPVLIGGTANAEPAVGGWSARVDAGVPTGPAAGRD